MFDCLIIGGGVSGLQCALVLGSAKDKVFAENKKIGILNHQDKSHLKNALFNNMLGLPIAKLGREILVEGSNQLESLYPHVEQIKDEKVISISEQDSIYIISTEDKEYKAKNVVVALNYSKPMIIGGLEQYVEKHSKANPAKARIQLRNCDHLIKDGLYVCGTIAGHRSQFAIAAGSGAAVATDILSFWNNGVGTKVHDKIVKK